MKKLTLIVLFFLSIIVTTVSRADNSSNQGFINVPGGPVWYKVSGQERVYHYSLFMADQEAPPVTIRYWSHLEINDQLFVMIN
jgi:hypothetical protein